jgi:hypothetical protein
VKRRDKVLFAFAALALVLTVFYFVALGLTNQQQRAALARLEEPPILAVYRDLTVPKLDAARETPNDLAQARRSIEAFEKVADDLNAIPENELWDDLREPLRKERELTEEEWLVLDAFLSENRALLDRAHALAAMGGPFAVIDLTKAGTSDHWFVLHELAKLLKADAQLAIRLGDNTRAAQDLSTIVGLGKALADEPLMMSQLVRLALYTVVYKVLADDFSPVALTPSDERTLIERLAAGLDRERFALAYSGEAVLGRRWFDDPDMEMVFPEAESPLGQFIETNLLRAYISPLARPLLNRDAASYLETLARLQEITKLPYVEAAPQLAALEESTANASWTRVFTRRSVYEPVFGFPRAHALFEARIAVTRVGLTIERYHAEHGAYPESLEQIATRLPGGIPPDPFTGAPLIYQPSSDSFLLYSIGPNQTDDGGRHHPHRADITWRGAEEPRP